MKALLWSHGSEYVYSAESFVGVFNTIHERLELEDKLREWLLASQWADALGVEQILEQDLSEIEIAPGQIDPQL